MKLLLPIFLASTVPANGQLISAKKRLRFLSEIDGDSMSMLAGIEDMSMSTMHADMSMGTKSSKSGKASKSTKQCTAKRINVDVPLCSCDTPSCSSGDLLQGRGNFESGSPNTIEEECTDGTFGTYLRDESVESITVSSLDGGDLQAGNMAKIEAVVFAWPPRPTADSADFFYTDSIENPVWKHIDTIVPTLSGLNTLEAQYILPESDVQAVRVIMRYRGFLQTCATRGFDDNDDLVFSVAEGTGLSDSTSTPKPLIPEPTMDSSICALCDQQRCGATSDLCEWDGSACVPLE